MSKALVFELELCIASFVFSCGPTCSHGRRPIERAVMGGIGYLLVLLMICHFAPDPEPNNKRETNYQKFVVGGLEIIIAILLAVAFMGMITMILGSLVEMGYVSWDDFSACIP